MKMVHLINKHGVQEEYKNAYAHENDRGDILVRDTETLGLRVAYASGQWIEVRNHGVKK